MSLLVILPLVAATISFTVGFFDFLPWLQRKNEKYPLAFVASCLCIGLFGLACMGEYTAATIDELQWWLRCEAALLNLAGIAFLGHINNQTNSVPPRVFAVVVALGVVGAVVQAIGFGDLSWDRTQVFQMGYTLPGGIPVEIQELRPGIITQIMAIYGVALMVYSLLLVLRFHRSGSHKISWPLLVILSIVTLAFMNDMMVDQGWYSFPYLVAYSWLVAVVVVGIQRGQELVEAGRIRRALDTSEIRYRSIFKSLQDVYFQTDVQGRIVLLSPSVETVFGYRPEELLGRQALRLVAEDRERRAIRDALAISGQLMGHELILRGPGWRGFEVSMTAHSSGASGGIEGMIREISERKESERALRAALREKEILLNEIHHRVKNNLQMVNSLLKLQIVKLEDPKARSVLQDCRNQVFSMALIHDDLYHSTDLKNINFGPYLQTLVSRLLGSSDRADQVKFEAHLDPVNLELDKAIPCGLIVNELCTNALKYAFPPGFSDRQPVIRVSLTEPVLGMVRIEVADNGVGMPPHFDPAASTSLGFRIITRLCDQLSAKLVVIREGGARFVIEFI